MGVSCRCRSLLTLLPVTLICLMPLSCGKSRPPATTGASTPSDTTPPPQAPTNRTGAAAETSPESKTQQRAAQPPKAEAQPRAAGSQAADGAPRETPAGNPIDDRVRGRLGEMIAAYRRANSYQDDTEFRVTHTQSGPLSVRFERPNKLDARIVDARIVSDGKQQTVYLPHLRQHMVGEAPETIDARKPYGDTVPAEIIDSPIGRISVPLQLLLAERPWDAVLDEVIAISIDESPAIIDGREHDVVRLDKVRADAVLYVDRETALIRRLEIDISELLGADTTGRLLYSLEIKNAQVDAPQEPFQFQPPSNSKAVQKFDFPLLPDELPPDTQPAVPSGNTPDAAPQKDRP